MSDDLKPGDRVEWNAHGGKTKKAGKAVGKIEKKLTSEMQIKGHTVKASPEHPEFLVKSDKSGAEAAHRPSALRKID